MPSAELAKLALAAHGAVALLSLGGGLARYSERADLYTKVMQETEALLGRMRQEITTSLEGALGDLFTDQLRGTPTVIVDPTASPTYSERPVNPVGSDRFRECLRGFVDGKVVAMIDYHETVRAHSLWCAWARLRRWDVYILTVWQIVCVAALTLSGNIIGTALPDQLVGWSFLPTGVGVLGFLLSELGLLLQQDVIDAKRNRYPGL